MLAKVTQRFVDEDVVWFFKEKAVKAVMDSNSLHSDSKSLASSGNLSSRSSKKTSNEYLS